MLKKNFNKDVVFGTDIAGRNMEHMEYLGNYRHLGQAVAEIQAGLLAQLHARCGAVGRAARHWPSDSPFRLRPNDPVHSGLYDHPASAPRAAAQRLGALLVALLFAASGAAQAKTFTALTPSFSDVNKAVGSAADGDTVIIPAGKANWTSQLVITRAITLMGATTTDSVAGTADDANGTTIVDSRTTTGGLIRVASVAGKKYRISGFTFGSVRTNANGGGFLALQGQSQSVRVDNCHFTEMTTQAKYFMVSDGVCGVADHNVIEYKGAQVFGFYNGTDGIGNIAWSQPTAWGSSQFFFVEDNYIKKGNTTSIIGDLTDGSSCCRFVIRHNHLYNCHIVNHGTEGVERGGRAMEIYNNDFHNNIAAENFPGGSRSGGVLFYNNTFDGNAIYKGFALAVFRTQNTWAKQAFTGWEGASGRSPWDVNDTEGNGTYMEGCAPFQYFPFSGSATAGSGTIPTKIVDSGNPGWATDKWKKLYGIYHVEDGYHNQIDDTVNGNTNLVGNTAGFSGHPMTWAPGSHYEIYRCLVVLDQEGRGQGDLIVGSPGSFYNKVTGKRSWPHQVLDPVYSWNNHHSSGKSIGCHSGYPTMLENRDWYNQAAAVNGVQLTGVGVGTRAQRPARGVGGVDVAHVTANPPGTAYWATDVPSINGSTDKGALYVWRGSAWVIYYQPYTYPHPLAFPQ